MNIIRVNLSTRLGQATTGDVQALADDPLVNSVVLVQVTPTGAQRRAFPVHHDPRRNSYDRGAAEEVFTGTFDDALAELREQIVNVDLIEPDERRIAIGVESVSDAPAHLDDLLGPLHHSIICNNLMPTRAELLTRLGGYLGVAFHLYDGPGLPNMERQVLSDFVILDRTVGDILDDLVLMTNPRTWMTAGVVHVDGRELGQAQLPAIPTASNINRVFVAGGEYFPPDAGEPDPGEDPEENFETSDDATHEWVEYTHAGEDSQETHYRLVKQDGNLVLEEEMRYGYVQTTSGPRWVMTYHVRKEHDFLPYCRGALVRSVETVRQTRTDMVFWTSRVNTITGITHVRDWAPDLILSSRKLVTQRWHAEGWLLSLIHI